MAVWFEGSCEVSCDLEAVARALEDPGAFYTSVVALLPGLTDIELVDGDGDSITIRTNEGVMHRANISREINGDRIIVEFDETYEAGSKFTATSHFREEFSQDGDGVTYHLVMSDVAAGGFLGFFYRKLGSAKIGDAFLDACKSHLEA